MVRSTAEPSAVEFQGKEKVNNGVLVDLLVHWGAQKITVDDVDGQSYQEWEYEEEKLSVVYQGDQSELDNYLTNHEQELIKRAKAKVDKLEQADKETLSYPAFKSDSTYKGTIVEIDGAKKKVKVEKTVSDRTVSAWCYADYTLLLAYQNSDLAVGDMVIISFVDEDLDLPYAHGLPLGV